MNDYRASEIEKTLTAIMVVLIMMLVAITVTSCDISRLADRYEGTHPVPAERGQQ